MGLYRRGKVWYYRFHFLARRYEGSTRLTELAPAKAFEADLRRALRLQAAGLGAEFLPDTTPRFSDWAEIAFAYLAPRRKRPEALEDELRVVLRFWGGRPAVGAVEGEPYHDLRLADPIRDPSWLHRFERWMASRIPHRPHAKADAPARSPIAAGTRNHYRTALSRLYAVALLPQFRAVTHITANPFRDLPRETTQPRRATVTVEQLRAWVAAASYHVRLAMAIGSLAPKLRRTNILRLRWDQHLDADLTWITVRDHKTDRRGEPLVIPISDALRAVLEDARSRARRRGVPWVVSYRGRPLKDVRCGVRAAAEAAGLRYGLQAGVTFHSLRHTLATLLAAEGLPEKQRAEALGHASIQTTQRYTHLRPVHQVGAHETIGQLVPLLDVVTGGPTRAVRKRSA